MQTHLGRIAGLSPPPRHPAMSVDELLRMLLPDPCANHFPSLDTPYSKYSNTNHAASGRDVRAITEIVDKRRAQLDEVTAELASVSSIMVRIRDIHQQLVDKRDQIVASMQAHQGLISSIRRLPPEILGEIFLRCLPFQTYVEPDTAAAPLLLLAVCRGWRRVALGTPRLWCSLSVRPCHGIQQCGSYFYHYWLARSRGCPLSLAVDTRRPPGNPVWRYEVTELLQPYTSRVVRLHVTFDEATAPDLLLKDVPMLQYLTLDGDLGTAQKMAVVQSQLRLRSLTLDVVSLGMDTLSAFNPGWTHLTQLQVTFSRATRQLTREATDGTLLLALLTLCPHLEDFSFSPVLISHNHSQRVLTHAGLRSLDIDVVFGAGYLLDALTLPALRRLHVRGMDLVPDAWQHDVFKAFLARSRCPLEILEIRGARAAITKAARQELAWLVPTLKCLDLDLCLAARMHV